MEMFTTYLWVFLIGGAICAIGQLIIIRTKITSARVLVIFVLVGVVLEACMIYEPISAFAKAGVNTPIIGFGASLARGAIRAVQARGPIGMFTGGLEATAAGIATAVFFAYIFSLIFKAKTKQK